MEVLLTWRHGCLAFFLLLLLFPSYSVQQINVSSSVYLNCLRNSTTSLSSRFTRNLNTALSNFTSLSSQGSHYAISTAGSSGQDMVYAVFQCRSGDVSGEACGECVKNASAYLVQECPESVGARIRLEGCFLRYDNQSFFVLDTSFVLGMCNTAKTTNVTTLGAIADLMENVTSEAAKQRGFASASENGIFAAAQCLGYLSQPECLECLSTYPYASVCGNSTLGQQVYLASCDYRYEAYNFLEAPSAAPALPPSLSSPTPAPAPGGPPLSLQPPAAGGPPLSLQPPAPVVPQSPPPASSSLCLGNGVPVLFVSLLAQAVLLYS